MKPIRPEMEQHPLSQSAREVNTYAEKHGIEETCEHYELKVDDVRYMAEQRALRALYAFKGVNLDMTKPTILSISHSEMPIYIRLTAAYMDGLVIGWRGKDISNGL